MAASRYHKNIRMHIFGCLLVCKFEKKFKEIAFVFSNLKSASYKLIKLSKKFIGLL